jgi:DNA-binding transcriptional LysR family regulator
VGEVAVIEFRHLRYFIAASDHGSFRKAGRALHIHESAISRRIRDLEDQLGASLFHRHNGGVFLTPSGHRFLRRARRALRQIDHGAHDVAAIGRCEDGRIKVGILSSLASGFLFNLLRVYKNEHPGIHIQLFEGNPSEHIAAIRQLRLDVAFITREQINGRTVKQSICGQREFSSCCLGRGSQSGCGYQPGSDAR